MIPPPPKMSKAGNIIYNVEPKKLEALRLTGDKNVVPPDRERVGMSGHRVIGSFYLCVDESGRYAEGRVIKSTGLPGYDARIAREMMRWTYRPYVIDGKPTPVCTAITFIYTQR